MIIECPDCKARYSVPEEKLLGVGKLKCSRCQRVFPIKAESDESKSQKDTAGIMQNQVSDSLWSNDSLSLPSDLKISLAIIKGARAGFIFKLEKPYVLIGRGKVDLIIPDKEISRKHAAIEVRGDKIFLRDLGSTNGTFMGSQKVSISEFSDQSEFRIGQTTLMLIATPITEHFEG